MSAFRVAVVVIIACVFSRSAAAQGVFLGSKDHRVGAIYGTVARIADKGPPLKLDKTKIEAKLVRVYYEGEVLKGGLVKPTLGEADGLTIGDFKVELVKKDLAKGYLETKEFGKVTLFFVSTLTSESCTLAVDDEQLKKIRGKIKKEEVE